MAADQDITAAQLRRQGDRPRLPRHRAPYAAFGIIGVYVTPDRERQRATTARSKRAAPGAARGEQGGRRGVVFTFDVPRKQVSGYGDPDMGTIFRCRRFVGGAEARATEVARRGRASAGDRRATKVGRRRTNVIATLPAGSRQRIILRRTSRRVVVQEDGVRPDRVRRYYAACRSGVVRDLQIAFASADDPMVRDGTKRYARRWTPSTPRQRRVRLRDRASRHAGDPPERRRHPAQVLRQGEPFLSPPGTAPLRRRRPRPPRSGGSST